MPATEGVLDRVVDYIQHRAPPSHPDGQPARGPVIQSGKSLLITARHTAQQCRVIALLGTRPHSRSRSRAPMHSLSQQQTRSVPIIDDQGDPRALQLTEHGLAGQGSGADCPWAGARRSRPAVFIPAMIAAPAQQDAMVKALLVPHISTTAPLAAEPTEMPMPSEEVSHVSPSVSCRSGTIWLMIENAAIMVGATARPSRK